MLELDALLSFRLDMPLLIVVSHSNIVSVSRFASSIYNWLEYFHFALAVVTDLFFQKVTIYHQNKLYAVSLISKHPLQLFFTPQLAGETHQLGCPKIVLSFNVQKLNDTMMGLHCWSPKILP